MEERAGLGAEGDADDDDDDVRTESSSREREGDKGATRRRQGGANGRRDGSNRVDRERSVPCNVVVLRHTEVG